ncbi:hypothetical protein MOQ_004857 [Trypanosoma cruzi marinkellei]|uniref:Uncharacterized protein n=1 Tax=Trypanosoma cruzi marinkellei TaxID=85056 RepID=K2MW10_TRYCR|nr:hypothetical protein MOQ_004857 [Trypanosoma cruzi marinkellei]
MDRVIAAAPQAERSQRPDLRRREVPREAFKTACASPAPHPRPRTATDGTAPRRHEKVGRLIELRVAEATRHPKHRPPPPTLTNARGLAPTTMAEPNRRPWDRRLAQTGRMGRPCAIEAVRRSAPFPAVQEAPTCRNRPAELATLGCHTPPHSGENGVRSRIPPTCHAGRLPRPAHVTHSCRTHPRCHRVSVVVAAIWLLARRPRPRTIAAPQDGHASRHPKTPRGGGLCGPRQGHNTADHDKIMLETRRPSIRNRTTRWSAAFPNNGSAALCVGKPASSPATPAGGVPRGTAPGPVTFIVVVKSLSGRLSNAPPIRHGFLADDRALITQQSDRGMISSTPHRDPSVVAE